MQAMTRKVEDRHFAVVQCFAFLREYGNLRGQPQVITWVKFRMAQQSVWNALARVSSQNRAPEHLGESSLKLLP